MHAGPGACTTLHRCVLNQRQPLWHAQPLRLFDQQRPRRIRRPLTLGRHQVRLTVHLDRLAPRQQSVDFTTEGGIVSMAVPPGWTVKKEDPSTRSPRAIGILEAYTVSDKDDDIVVTLESHCGSKDGDGPSAAVVQ